MFVLYLQNNQSTGVDVGREISMDMEKFQTELLFQETSRYNVKE